MMYGSVLSGGLAGHVHGTAAYDLTSTGEPAGWRPHIWTALKYESGAQMQHLKAFVMSEGKRYQDLVLASADLEPRSIPDALADGLDGWSFLMRTQEKDFALAYFENKALRTRMKGFAPAATYRWTWFDPQTGKWGPALALKADAAGVIASPPFMQGGKQASRDVAAKIVRAP
jgi:hypothetical protein